MKLSRFCLSLLATLLISGCAMKNKPIQEPAGPVRVALINDASCTDPKSRDAAWNIISAHPGFEASQVSATGAAEGAFANHDVVIFPGGTGNGQARALGPGGGDALENYVRGGGGIVAICAGGYLVSEGYNDATRACELVNGKLHDLDNWARGEGMVQVAVAGEDSTRTMWFQNGPILVPAGRDDLPVYTSLVKYASEKNDNNVPPGNMKDRDAIVAAPFGDGRVVVFGPHPELSPEVNHWLVNAVAWASGRGPEQPSVSAVLEGK